MIRLPLQWDGTSFFEGDATRTRSSRWDVIYVPETKKPNWTSIFSFVGGLKTFKDLLGF